MRGKTHPNKGKTLEEICGFKRAAELREQLIDRNKANRGKPSKWKGVSYIERFGKKRAAEIRDAMSRHPSNQRMTGKSYDEIYGSDRAGEIRQKQSDAAARRGALAKTSSGISGTYHGRHFRSTLELAFLIAMHECDRLIHVSVEPITINYTTVDDIVHRRTYTPDFLLHDTCELIEIKPQFKITHGMDHFAEKKDAAEKYCQQHGLQYTVLTEHDLQQWWPGSTRKTLRKISGVILDCDKQNGD